MAIRVTQDFINKGSTILNNAWDEVVSSSEAPHCRIEECISTVLAGKVKTYKYILLTQLLGKAVDSRVNILAMKASSSLEGAWDARNLCEGAITVGGFEKNVLLGVLGMTKQPYNNAPGQKPELSKDNATRSSDIPLRDMLIDALGEIKTSEEAYLCIKFYLAECERQIMVLENEGPALDALVGSRSCVEVSRFLSDVAAYGGEGEGLALASALLLDITLGQALGYEIRLRYVNASRSGQGDIDIYYVGERFATIELKDKPFTAEEVCQYATTAFREGCSRFCFVFGVNAGDGLGSAFERTFTEQQLSSDMMASCLSFESLKDSLLLMTRDIDLAILREKMLEYIEMARIKPVTATYAREAFRRLGE